MIAMDKVLVVGASGMLGTRAIEMYGRAYDMFGTYHTHKLDAKNMFHLDVTKRVEVNALVEKIKPDLIIDTHTLPNVDYCELHPDEAWEINVNGTKNVAEAAKTLGAKYVYISTDTVFDGKKLEYSEKDKPNPMNYYSKTKWIGELILEALNVNYIVLRSAVLYGKGGSGKVPFALWLVDQLKRKQQVKIVVDQSENPTFVDNLVDVLFKLFKDDATGIFHATGSECMSRYEFSKTIAKAFNLDSKYINPITTPELHQVAPRPGRVKMNTGKVERATGMHMMGPEEGLKLLKQQLAEE